MSALVRMRRAVFLVGLGAALVAPGAATPTRAAPGLRSRPSHLLFTSNRDGDGDLYALDPGGRRLAALTVNRREDEELVVSRDGRHIAFRRGALYVADGAGRHLERVDGRGYPAAWSPDGSRLAFLTGPEGSKLAVVDADGTRKQLVADAGEGGTFAEVGGWSADGRELAFTRYGFDPSSGDTRSDLLVAAIGGPARVLSSTPGETVYSAAWSPTANALAYVQHGGQLLVANLDTGETVVPAAAFLVGAPVWSPDGARLLYGTSDSHGLRGTLKATDLQSGITTHLATAAGLGPEADPEYAWSPDSRTVAFTDRLGLSVVGADGQGVRLLRRGSPSIGEAASITHPRWSPDGRALAFEDDGLRVVRADGSGLRTLATRGSTVLAAWAPGPVPKQAPRAPALPPVEIASRLLLRSRGRIEELVASGMSAGVLSARSRLDCRHVVVWSPSAPALARAARPIPCAPYGVSRLGGLSMYGRRLGWSDDWGCSNSECDRVSYSGLLYGPRLLRVRKTLVAIFFDVGHQPRLPCVVCGLPSPTSRRPDVVPGRVAAYVRGRAIYLRLLRTRALRVLRPPGDGRVLARLTSAGLFYAFSLDRGSYPGRVAFVPLAALRR